MNSIHLTELNKVTYLKTDNLNGRIVTLLPFWDGKEWHVWLPTEKGLQHIRPLDAAKGSYIAKNAARESDLYIPFVNLMWQRASYEDIAPLTFAICADFYNLSVSLEKLKHIFNTKHLIKSSNAGGFVANEIEYLLTVIRSIFDLLYEIVKLFWDNHTQLQDIDAEKKRKSRTLPKKFSKFILDKEKPRTADELEKTFCIPAPLAQEFAKYGLFFAQLRSARDKIVHSGKSLDIIFITEKGFCVSPTNRPFSDFYSITNHQSYYYNESIVSILPWISNIIFGTIAACNSLVHTFASIVLLPPELAPEFKIFIRDPSGHSLIDALKIYQGGDPWWDSTSPTTEIKKE
jgi:hypothetical protein